jgi:hypothetical protein
MYQNRKNIYIKTIVLTLILHFPSKLKLFKNRVMRQMFVAESDNVTGAEENYMKWSFTIDISSQLMLG